MIACRVYKAEINNTPLRSQAEDYSHEGLKDGLLKNLALALGCQGRYIDLKLPATLFFQTEDTIVEVD